MLELQLPPGKTTFVQLLSRVVGSDVPGPIVGSPIAGVPQGSNSILYQFDLGIYENGDFWGQLDGVSNPNGLPFPIRNSIPYVGIPWSIIDATVFIPTIIAPPNVASVCRVQLRARRGATPLLARALITCGSTGRLAESAFTDIAFDGLTDAAGLLLVDLPWSSLAGVGRYRFKLIDVETGSVFHDRTLTVPDLSNANYEDLT